MPIGIGIKSQDGSDRLGIGCQLEQELVEYFASQPEYNALARLRELDPYGDTRIDEPWRLVLLADLRRFRRAAEHKWLLPKPPPLVGTGGSIPGERFGWRGMMMWLDRFEATLSAVRPGEQVWAFGD